MSPPRTPLLSRTLPVARTVTLAAVAVLASTACGSSTASTSGDAGTSDVTVPTKDSGTKLTTPDVAQPALTVIPSNPTLTVPAPGATLAFSATLGAQKEVASWTLGVAGAGSIDKNGLFTASGLVGGPVLVTANAGGMTASTTLTIDLQLTENPGMVSAATQGLLTTGGKADPGFAWLYPYDKTIWPNDLPAPTLQFGAGGDAGAGFDAALVKVTFPGLTYTGFYGPGATAAQIPLSATAWNAITRSATATSAVSVAVTKIAGGQVTGPITETWTIASGGLRGSIFYNSYDSPLAGNEGAVLKLRPAEQQLSVVVSTAGSTCHVCHAVAANGSIMVAANEGASMSVDSVWDLTVDGGTTTPLFSAPDRTWDFGAFTPDGKKFLRYGAVPWTDPNAAWAPDVRGMGNGTADVPSALFDPRTGNPLDAGGLNAGPGGAPLNMMMPIFSPDGKEVAFNHYDTGAGATVAVMDFDTTTNTFSNLRDVATLPSGQYAGWPTFTPDDQFLLFAAGTNVEYDTLSDNTAVTPEPASNIFIAHIPSKTIAPADQMNGLSGGKVYLPFPDDKDLNFEPTILPVAAGGYYWAVFTTRRNYGNTINGDPYAGPAGAPSPRKKLWVTALTIAPAPGQTGAPTAALDLSHPAFYLEGQELTAGNMRAFWALDPCEQAGTSCTTGDQCCTGYCRQSSTADGGASFSCVATPAGCSQASEKCTTAADCCGESQGYTCINGFCAQPSPR